MTQELSMPTNFYHYKARFPYNYQNFEYGKGARPSKDDGVFASENLSGHTFYQGIYAHPYRITSLNTLGGIGGINMENHAATEENARYITTFAITQGNGTASGKLVVQRGANGEAGLENSGNWLTSFGYMPGVKGQLVVHKTELACPYTIKNVSSSNFECVYATGISAIMSYDDGSKKTQSVIIARLPAIGKDYPEALTDKYYWCPGGSAIVCDSGSVVSLITGDTLGAVTIKEVTQSIPESAIVSNDGVLAVACMVTGDGYARWLGYKNGIYKIYQGTALHNGMPGEKVTIKGHEFVCLAYGPFYARLS